MLKEMMGRSPFIHKNFPLPLEGNEPWKSVLKELERSSIIPKLSSSHLRGNGLWKSELK